QPLSRDFTQDKYGGAEIQNAMFEIMDRLIFDELGGPAASLTGDEPAGTGTVEIRGPSSRFRIAVEAYTGRVTVTQVE
ncbi:MAG: hypothetical protein VYC34_04065, partial [Planctomycetota bacterium]|nr:hypothetical protein [Planctomycetota bacterium]